MQSIKKEIDEAVEKAKAASVPPKEMLWTNTYKDTLGVSTRGIDSKTKVKLWDHSTFVLFSIQYLSQDTVSVFVHKPQQFLTIWEQVLFSMSHRSEIQPILKLHHAVPYLLFAINSYGCTMFSTLESICTFPSCYGQSTDFTFLVQAIDQYHPQQSRAIYWQWKELSSI